MNLSPHFTLEEMVATQHRGISNDPPLDVVANLKATANGLEAVRVLLGAPMWTQKTPRIHFLRGPFKESPPRRYPRIHFPWVENDL